MAFNISYIANKALPIRNVGANTFEFVPKINNNLGPGEKLEIINTDTLFVLDYLEWSCNHDNDIRIQIEVNTSKGVQHIGTIPSVDGGVMNVSARPNNILNHRSGIWDILEYHEGNNQYKFRLNLRGLEFPKGCNIYIENTGDVSRKAAAIYYGREL